MQGQVQKRSRYADVLPAGGERNTAQGYQARNRLIVVMCAAVGVICLLFSQTIFSRNAGHGMLQSAAIVSAGLELGAETLLQQPPPSDAMAELDFPQPMAGIAAPQSREEAVTLKEFDITATPKDVLVLMEEAKAEFADQKKDGDIQSRTYTAKDATHQFGKLLVRNTTETQQNRAISKDLAAPLDLKIDKSKPAVLIFHTHTTEGYEILDRSWYATDWVSRTENGAKNVVRVGDAIAEMLERAGFEVIHETEIFDRQYTGAYDKSRVAVLRHLAENPSIQVTLDVHRDAIHTNNGVHIKPVAEIGKKKAAQVMIITGVNEGNIKDFPNWEKNLAFAAKVQMAGEKQAPGLMRPLFFSPRRYNMNVTPFSLLLEMGSDANTLEEAIYSGRLMGTALADLLEDYVVSG